MRRTRRPHQTGRLRVGDNYYSFAAGEISGRELCEAEGLADYGREDEVSEDEQRAEGGQLPPPDPEAGGLAESEAEQGRRDLEAAMQSGELSLAGLFDASGQESEEHGHRIAGHMHLKRALLALPHIGEIRANEILDALNLDGGEHIDQVGTQQQAALVEAVEAES